MEEEMVGQTTLDRGGDQSSSELYEEATADATELRDEIGERQPVSDATTAIATNEVAIGYPVAGDAGTRPDDESFVRTQITHAQLIEEEARRSSLERRVESLEREAAA